MPISYMIRQSQRTFTKTLAQKARQSRCVSYKLTVANIDAGQNARYAVITFYQSQRFYKLPKHSAKYAAYFQLLKHSQKTKMPIYVYRRTEYSDTITKVVRIRSKH